MQGIANKLRSHGQKLRVNFKILDSLSYNSVNPHDILCVNEKIEKIISDFKATTPVAEGMIIRPLIAQRCKRKLTKQIIRKYGNLQLYQKEVKRRVIGDSRTELERKQKDIVRYRNL